MNLSHGCRIARSDDRFAAAPALDGREQCLDDSNNGVKPDKDSEPDSAGDITLEETVRILGDYVMLSRASVKPNLAATLPSPHQPLNRRRNFREVKFRWGNRWAASIIGSGAPIG